MIDFLRDAWDFYWSGGYFIVVILVVCVTTGGSWCVGDDITVDDLMGMFGFAIIPIVNVLVAIVATFRLFPYLSNIHGRDVVIRGRKKG